MRILAALASLILLASCGGGGAGGGGGGGGPPADQPPTITSAAAVAVAENSTGVIYQATATDPDSSQLAFRIEGTDAARFTMSVPGALTFNATPDFEAPTDADANNVYLIQVVVTDGAQNSTRRDLTVTVTNVPDLSLRRIAGFNEPMVVSPVPGSTRIFVGEKAGAIYLTDPAQPGPGTLYLQLADISSGASNIDTGLLGVVAAPDYAVSGRIYVFLTNGANGIDVRRYGRLPSGLGDPASGDVILRLPSSINFLGRGGGLAFGPDGFLYVGTPDSNPSNNTGGAGNTASLYGKVLRLDVSGDDFPADPDRDYHILASNPFVGGGGAGEVYAYGLENPRNLSFEGANLLIADAHRFDPLSTLAQEVHLLRPADAGANFGFRSAPAGALPPVIEYQGTGLFHSALLATAFVYHGPIAQLNGLFIFGDRSRGLTWSVPGASLVQGTTVTEGAFTVQPLAASAAKDSPVNFGTDSLGNLYIIFSATPRDDIYLVMFG